MILKGKKKSTPSISPFWVIAALIVGIVGYSIYDKGNQWETPKDNVIFCDAEKIEGDKFVTNGQLFNNSKTQSSDKSYNGKYSSMLSVDGKYGMSYILNND